MSDYQSFIDDDSMDGKLRQAKIELHAAKRIENKVYQTALEFHVKMSKGTLKHSDKNVLIWDRAILKIRAFRKKHYLRWIHMDKEDQEIIWEWDKKVCRIVSVMRAARQHEWPDIFEKMSQDIENKKKLRRDIWERLRN